jgi:hypothetical protein
MIGRDGERMDKMENPRIGWLFWLNEGKCIALGVETNIRSIFKKGSGVNMRAK